MAWEKATKIEKLPMQFQLIGTSKFVQIFISILQYNPVLIKPTNFVKITLLISAIRNVCFQLPREEHCLIDEQTIPFTERVPAKQFVKRQTKSFGIKKLCGLQ